MNPSNNSDKVLLDLQNVGFFYWRKSSLFRKSRFWVLKDINLQVYKGETLGIIGRNGVGKSTLLRVLAGIVMPDAGHLVRNCGQVSLLALRAGFNNHLTGRENAIFNGMLLGLSKEEVLSRIDDIIEFSELGDFFDQPIKTYSSGMKARLAFATAMQADPELFLVDEVLGVGDAAFKEKSVEVMKAKICSDHTVVMVSHNLKLVDEVCQRVLWIENGETRACGETRPILIKYLEYIREQQILQGRNRKQLESEMNVFENELN